MLDKQVQLLLLSFVFVFPVICHVLVTTSFTRKRLCGVQSRLSSKCMIKSGVSASITNCCARCSFNSSCLGASLDASTKGCYLHTACFPSTNCTGIDASFIYFEKNVELPIARTTPKPLSCKHGIWNETTSSCSCDLWYVDDLCDRLPYNCSELYENFPSERRKIFISLKPFLDSHRVRSACDRTDSCVYTYILYSKGDMDLNRTWSEYLQGFHMSETNSSFWVGLNALTGFLGPDPRNIGLEMTFSRGASVREITHRYTGVVVGNDSTNYMFKYQGHTSVTDTAEGDCLELSNMTSFSTWDADHDGDGGENWALKAGGGWWLPPFNFTCNPMGSFYNGSTIPATDDGYVRFPGVNLADIRNHLVKIELYIEDDYI